MIDIKEAISALRDPCGVPPTRQREIADILERVEKEKFIYSQHYAWALGSLGGSDTGLSNHIQKECEMAVKQISPICDETEGAK